MKKLHYVFSFFLQDEWNEDMSDGDAGVVPVRVSYHKWRMVD